MVDGWQTVTWTERRLLLRSVALAHSHETALRARVARAQHALADLTVRRHGKPRLRTVAAVQQALTRWWPATEWNILVARYPPTPTAIIAYYSPQPP